MILDANFYTGRYSLLINKRKISEQIGSELLEQKINFRFDLTADDLTGKRDGRGGDLAFSRFRA